MKRNYLFLTIILALATVGCSSTNWMKKPDLDALKLPGPPAKALAVWEPAVKHDSDKEPQRGFGGRVYFYDQDARKPVKVKGSVVVYAFDEDGRAADDNVPTRSYYFEKSDVKKLYSKSKLGHSYNLWIPWDAEGPEGDAKKVSLIVRYLPDVGSSVVSSQAVVYLPGKAGQNQATAQADWDRKQESYKGTIQQVAHLTRSGTKMIDGMRYHELDGLSEKELAEKGPAVFERLVESNSNRPASMQTTTINLPTNVSRNMQNRASVIPPSPAPPVTVLPLPPVGVESDKNDAEVAVTKKDPMGRGAHALPARQPAVRSF